jgi:hypothetical protein
MLWTARVSRNHCERGQTSAEYVGLLAFVAAVVLIVVAAAPGIGGTLRSKIVAAIEGVSGGGGAPGGPGTPGDPSNPGDPVAPGDPTDPTDPADPSDPADPADPTDPTDPTDPAFDPTSAEGDDDSVDGWLMPAFEGISGAIGFLQSRRDRVSTLGRLLSTHPSFAVRSAAGRLLRPLGEATAYGRSPWFRGLARSMPVIGFGLGTIANLGEGQSPFEAVSRSALTTGGGVLAGMGASAAVCGAAAVATAGVGGLVCGGAVLGAGLLGGVAGDFVGDVLFSDSAQEFYSDVGDFAGDAWEGAGDVASDVGDTLTFWD